MKFKKSDITISPFQLTQVLLSAVFGGAIFWWSIWLLISAQMAGPLNEFPFGFNGYFFLAVLSVSAIIGLFIFFTRHSFFYPEQKMNLFPKDGWLFLIAVCLILIFWKNALIRGWTPVNSLLLYVFHPLESLVGEYIQRGMIPLWNPWSNCGMPLMADVPIGAFYPLNLFFYILGFPLGFRFWVFAHMVLFYLLTFLWLRDKDYQPFPAFLGGCLAIFNAYVVWHMGYTCYLASMIWVPAILHSWEKQSWGTLVLLIGVQLLAGYPFYSYVACLIIGILLIWKKSPLSVWGWTALSIILGFLLVSFQTLPSWELFSQSLRSGPLSYEVAVRFSHSFGQLFKILFLPLWIYGSPSLTGDPTITAFYVGPFVFLAAGWAVYKSPSKTTFFSLGCFFLGCFFSLGQYNPFYKIFFSILPGFNFFRFPAHWMILSLIGLILLFSDGHSKMKKSWSIFLGIALLLDLFIFNLRSPYLYVNPSFLHHKSSVLERIQKEGGRVMETENLERWRYGDITKEEQLNTPFESWMKVKENMTISQTIPFHIPEAKSITNHTLKKIDALHQLSYKNNSLGKLALQSMGVKHILDFDKREGKEIFQWNNFSEAYPLIRTLSGAPLNIKTANNRGNISGFVLSTPWRGKKDKLILSESYFPGWKAFVNGESRPMEELDNGFRGLALREGDQSVLFRYDAPLFFIGIGISFIILLMMGFFILKKRQKTESSRSPLLLLGLLINAGGFFLILKSIYDFLGGQPYANKFSPEPWTFVTVNNFVAFGITELFTGLTLCGLGGILLKNIFAGHALKKLE